MMQPSLKVAWYQHLKGFSTLGAAAVRGDSGLQNLNIWPDWLCLVALLMLVMLVCLFGGYELMFDVWCFNEFFVGYCLLTNVGSPKKALGGRPYHLRLKIWDHSHLAALPGVGPQVRCSRGKKSQ